MWVAGAIITGGVSRKSLIVLQELQLSQYFDDADVAAPSLLDDADVAPPSLLDDADVRPLPLQGLRLPEAVVDRLQTVERRLSGQADEALPRLRGALPPSRATLAALDELGSLLQHLRVWGIEEHVTIDALMSPHDDFYSGAIFQVHLCRTEGRADGSAGPPGEGSARGGQRGGHAAHPAACVAVRRGQEQSWHEFGVASGPIRVFTDGQTCVICSAVDPLQLLVTDNRDITNVWFEPQSVKATICKPQWDRQSPVNNLQLPKLYLPSRRLVAATTACSAACGPSPRPPPPPAPWGSALACRSWWRLPARGAAPP